MGFELSICIPTYNRTKCLGDLLDSILGQVDESHPVEICISDDASSENTQGFLQRYMSLYPHILYHRFRENIGLDRNLLKSVEMARGEYIWLMGNDDKLEPGAIQLIIKRIKEYDGPTALNVNGYMYDGLLKERIHQWTMRGLAKSKLSGDQLFDDIGEIVSVFADSFGFLGDNVLKRAAWNEVVSSTDLSQYYHSYYIHLAVLFTMLRRSPRFLYVHQRCVGFRSNNDGFLQIVGGLRRLQMDAAGYSQVATGALSQSPKLYNLFLSSVVRCHIRRRVLRIKLEAPEVPMRELAKITYRYYGRVPAYWTNIVPIIVSPRPTILVLRAFYRMIKRFRIYLLNAVPPLH
jgi:abequosyltransferase